MDRNQAADREFNAYDFGPCSHLVSASSWQQHGNEWFRVLVLSVFDGSRRLMQAHTFRMSFAPATSVVLGALVLAEDGRIVGSRTSDRATLTKRRALAAGQAIQMHSMCLGRDGSPQSQLRDLLVSLSDWCDVNGTDLKAEVEASQQPRSQAPRYVA